MAVEAIRGCGYRKVGGLYLIGGYMAMACDRLPYEIGPCPTCGGGVHFSLAPVKINPLKLFGAHDKCSDKSPAACLMCDPPDTLSFLMVVGEKFYTTPQDFLKEAVTQGISKRIKKIPQGFKVGSSVFYLVHNHAISVAVPEGQKPKFKPGVFSAFRPWKVEQLVWERDMTPEKLEDMKKRGIVPVIIPDDDRDHDPKTGRYGPGGKPKPVKEKKAKDAASNQMPFKGV